VPIRFVPEAEQAPDKKKNDKSLTVKFKISATVKKTYKVLTNGGTEAFINHIKAHKTISVDCKLKEEVVAARSILIANRRVINNLTVADLVANRVQIENLLEANRELKDTICTLQKDAFDFFEKLLSPTLVVK